MIRSQAELSFVSSVTPDQAPSEEIKAKLIWVELESDPLGNLSVLETLIKSHPNTFFVVSKEDLEPELVKKAMQIGALDFLDHKGWAAQIRSVVRRVMAKEFGSKPAAGTPGRSTPGTNWNQLNSLKIQSTSSNFRRVDATRTMPAANRQPSEAERELAPLTEEQEEPAAESLQEVVTDTYSTEEIQVSEYPEEQYSEEFQTYAEGVEGYGEEELQYYYAEDGQLLYYTEDGQAYTEDGQAYNGLVYAQDGQVYGPDGQLYTGEGYSEEGYAAEEEGHAADAGYVGEEGYAAEESYQEAGAEVAEADQPGYAELSQGYSEDEQGYTTDSPTAEESFPQEEYQGSYGEESPLGASGEFSAHHRRMLEESGEFPAAQDPEHEAPLEQSLLPQKRDDDTAGSTTTIEPDSSADAASPVKARWDELDSIISTPKSEEKKETNKWADLDAIATTPKADKEPAKQIGKWGELDALSKPAAPARSKEPTTGSKWGDLDAITASGKPTQEDIGSTWTESEEIGGSEVSVEIGIQSSSNWSELGEITASSVTSTTPATKWGDLDSTIGAPPSPSEEPAERKPAGKWGELDAIGSASAKTSFPKGEQPQGAQRKAPGKWGELDSIQAKSPDPPSGTISKFTRKTQNIELPQKPEAEQPDLKKSDLDSIQTPKVVGPVLGPEESKWGNLDKIPTPGKKAAEPWVADLESIPTPAPKTGPTLVEGALPVRTAQSKEASKWKMGMSTDMSTGAREVGAMRDKLKDSVPPIKVSWGKLNWVVAVVVLASQLYLVFNFCNYPSPPVEVSMGR